MSKETIDSKHGKEDMFDLLKSNDDRTREFAYYWIMSHTEKFKLTKEDHKILTRYRLKEM